MTAAPDPTSYGVERRSASELAAALALVQALEHERIVSDTRYAMKLVERIVFAQVGLIPGVRRNADYSPTEGDTVAMLTDGQDLFVLCKLA